jgi:mannose PTS system EIIA component
MNCPEPAKMAGILIIAHAPLATALKSCLSHVYGSPPVRIGVLDVAPDSDPVQLVKMAQAELSRLTQHNGALVLSDLFGATPANIAAQLAVLPQVRVLVGVNLPMLVRAVCYRSTPLSALVEKTLAGGAKGIQQIATPVLPSYEPCQAAYHATTKSHHC